jgi:hypothetical protein
MSSYSAGTQYGYDEINVNSSDFAGIGSNFDSSGIKSIKSREMRLQQKLNMNQCNPYDDLKVDHYSEVGIDRTKSRRKIIRNPEDYFVMGQNDYTNNNKKNNALESFKNPVDIHIKTLTKKNSKMQEVLEELDRKNDILTFFIFFLVIMIIVQYSKSYKDPTISVMILDPRATQSEPHIMQANVITTTS